MPIIEVCIAVVHQKQTGVSSISTHSRQLLLVLLPDFLKLYLFYLIVTDRLLYLCIRTHTRLECDFSGGLHDTFEKLKVFLFVHVSFLLTLIYGLNKVPFTSYI